MVSDLWDTRFTVRGNAPKSDARPYDKRQQYCVVSQGKGRGLYLDMVMVSLVNAPDRMFKVRADQSGRVQSTVITKQLHADMHKPTNKTAPPRAG